MTLDRNSALGPAGVGVPIRKDGSDTGPELAAGAVSAPGDSGPAWDREQASWLPGDPEPVEAPPPVPGGSYRVDWGIGGWGVGLAILIAAVWIGVILGTR